MLDEVMHNIMEGLPQELPVRQDVRDCLSKSKQSVGFNLVLSFHVADVLGCSRISHFQLFENHVFFRMMAALGVVLEILDNCLQNFVIWSLAAIEDFQFLLQNEEQLFNVSMLFEQNLNNS